MRDEIRVLPEPPLADLIYIMSNLRELDWIEASAMAFSDDPKEWAARLHAAGPYQWAVYLNGTPVATMGAVPRWLRVWSGWTLGTADFPRVAYTVTKFLRRNLIPGVFAAGAIRLDCMAYAGYEITHPWLLSLGAMPETALANWGKNGETFIQYSWLREATKSPERTAGADMAREPHELLVL